MSQTYTVYLHFPCFDGIVSAVLVSEYLKRKHDAVIGEFVPVGYAESKTWLARPLLKPAAVVDFLYHPDADFWADHHQTSFLTPEIEVQFRERRSTELVYDEGADCCAEVIWRKAYRTLREPRFREMVEWARRIDSARYSSVEDAVLGEAPALRINLSLMQDTSADYCRYLVDSLRSMTLTEVASLPRVERNYKAVREATLSGQKLFRKASHLEKDKIVVFNVGKMGKAHLSRYAPYLEYPGARYSVGIFQTGEGAKITAMRNPWRRFKSVPLGRIFSRYGGGGHQRVASVLLKDADEAKQTLGSILHDIRMAGTGGSSLGGELAGGD
jgi:hypothetical protein